MTQALQIAPVLYRPALPEDMSFIFSSWLKSFRSSYWAKDIPGQIYFAGHKKVVQSLLDLSRTVVAVNPEDPEQIFGYGVVQPTSKNLAIVHYVYVKFSYRKLGIGSAILKTCLAIANHDPELPCVVSHATQALDSLRGSCDVIYNPYVIGAFE